MAPHRLFTSTKRNGVDIDAYVLNRVDGTIRSVLEGGWNRVECFSPDGRWLAVVRLDGAFALSNDLLLVDVETAEARMVVTRTGAGNCDRSDLVSGFVRLPLQHGLGSRRRVDREIRHRDGTLAVRARDDLGQRGSA